MGHLSPPDYTPPHEWLSGPVAPADRQSFKRFGTVPPGQEFLYLLRDSHGVLLYVGITWNPFVRWTYHSKTKPWWNLVARAEIYLCADMDHARQEETRWIKSAGPLHNIHQNGVR